MTRRWFTILALTACLPATTTPAQTITIAPAMRAAADRLIDAAMANDAGYARLAELVDRFPGRLSGSAVLEQANDWLIARMKDDGFANVRGEMVMVPHWVRGKESAMLTAPRPLALHFLGLGRSVGTPPEGITAPVLVVTSFADLTARAAQAKGRIVVYDAAFATDIPPLEAYSKAVVYRSGGATAAAKVGAVASLIRSVTPYSQQTPHTGAMTYDEATPKIPGGALSVEDVAMLHRMQDRGETPVITLKMEAQTLPDAPSRNVVAELVGRERPDEIVVLGGHIDSWDVGQGAMDDAGGVVAAWEAVRLIQQLGLRPRRTLRVVAFTNEENGTRGGRAYREMHASEIARHVAAIESDTGVFRPAGFRFQGTPAGLAMAKQVGALLQRIGAGRMENGGAEADVEPLIVAGVPGFGLDVDTTRYFWYHHTEADTLSVIDRDDLRRCIAAMAVLAYTLAESPEPIAR
jgi:carboxypeptidase Q